MKNTIRILSLLILSCSVCFGREKESIKPANFEKLMGIKSSKLSRFSENDLSLLEKYKAHYLSKYYLLAYETYAEKTPKVFHFIWVGPKKFPEKSIKNVVSWQKLHPTWKIKFWTDNASRECPVPEMEKHLISEIPFLFVKDYLNLTENYGEQSDLIRYEILYQEGGVYLDHDIECFEAIDRLVAHFDFFAPFEPIHISPIKTSEWTVTNCLIGSKPKHPILASTLVNIQKNWEKWTNHFSAEDRATVLRRVLHRTFKPFGNAVNEYMGKGEEFILPSAMVFPSHYSDRTLKNLKKNHLALCDHKWENTWFKDVPLTMEEQIFDEVQKIRRQNDVLNKKFHKFKLFGYILASLQFYLIIQIWYWKRRKRVA